MSRTSTATHTHAHTKGTPIYMRHLQRAHSTVHFSYNSVPFYKYIPPCSTVLFVCVCVFESVRIPSHSCRFGKRAERASDSTTIIYLCASFCCANCNGIIIILPGRKRRENKKSCVKVEKTNQINTNECERAKTHDINFLI